MPVAGRMYLFGSRGRGHAEARPWFVKADHDLAAIGDPAKPTRNEVDDALALARDIHEAVLVKLPPGVRP
ncbi:MAG: hypothetical protein IT348_19855 [Candidatus Eisenbacteria bacterium]|nr:hypothetical protein [Candidatus Eisenbacteria bacterium]